MRHILWLAWPIRASLSLPTTRRHGTRSAAYALSAGRGCTPVFLTHSVGSLATVPCSCDGSCHGLGPARPGWTVVPMAAGQPPQLRLPLRVTVAFVTAEMRSGPAVCRRGSIHRRHHASWTGWWEPQSTRRLDSRPRGLCPATALLTGHCHGQHPLGATPPPASAAPTALRLGNPSRYSYRHAAGMVFTLAVAQQDIVTCFPPSRHRCHRRPTGRKRRVA